MKCKRRGCHKEALEGKDYCGVVCSRKDNQRAFNKIVKLKGGVVKKPKKYVMRKRVKMKQDKSIKFSGNEYCKNFDPSYYTCVNCMEQAVFKYKSCYKEAENDMR